MLTEKPSYREDHDGRAAMAAPPPHWLCRRQESDTGALPAVSRVLPDPSPQPRAGAQEPEAGPDTAPIAGGAKR